MYEKLKSICKEKNTSITYVCEKVTGNKGNLQTWKKGYMRSDWLSKVADILGVSTDYILGRDEEPTQQNINNGTIKGTQGILYNVGQTEINGIQKEMLEAMEQLPKSKQLKALEEVYKMIDEKGEKNNVY